jgi:hypothetical protein
MGLPVGLSGAAEDFRQLDHGVVIADGQLRCIKRLMGSLAASRISRVRWV